MFDDIIVGILEKWGTTIVEDMKQELSANGSIASSQLYNSLSYNVQRDLDTFILAFSAEDYAVFVENGRSPGKFPPISKIKEWTRYKGIPEKAAFPIARNIFKFGIKPRPFIKPSINKSREQMISDLVSHISDAAYDEVRNELILTLKKKI